MVSIIDHSNENARRICWIFFLQKPVVACQVESSELLAPGFFAQGERYLPIDGIVDLGTYRFLHASDGSIAALIIAVHSEYLCHFRQSCLVGADFLSDNEIVIHFRDDWHLFIKNWPDEDFVYCRPFHAGSRLAIAVEPYDSIAAMLGNLGIRKICLDAK